MARRIEGPYDFSRHSFNTYADGATWELTEGEDFTIKPYTLTAAARQWGREEGIGVETKIVDQVPAIVAIRFTRVGKLRPLEDRSA
jgi:hypothetical protein